MTPENQRRTFISYSRVNQAVVVKLARELKSAGFPVWIDKLDIHTGSRWDDEVEKALRECGVFLVILTPDSIVSENVKDEIGYAIDHGKRILPVMLETCDVPLRLRRFQYVDFTTKKYKEGVRDVGELLDHLIEEISEPIPTIVSSGQDKSAIRPPTFKTEVKTSVPAKKSRSSGIAIGAIALLGLGLLAAAVIAVVFLNGRNTPVSTATFPPITRPPSGGPTAVTPPIDEPPSVGSTAVTPPNNEPAPGGSTVVTPSINEPPSGRSITITPSATEPPPSTGWSNWEDLGGVIQDGPAASSWGSNRLDVFARGQNDGLWHIAWDGSNWSNWEDLGGVITSSPGAVSWGPNRIDIFARGLDGQLWHQWWDNGWGNWEGLGGVIQNGPAVSSWGSNRLDVFARGQNDGLWHKYWDGAGWNDWEDLGGVITSSPGAASWGPNRIDIFARGVDGQLWHQWWDNGWGNWEGLGGVIQDAPAVSSWSSNRLDVFARGQNDSLWHIYWDGARWSNWEDLGGTITAAPAAVSWGPGRIDVFARGTDGHLWHIYWSE